MSEIATQDARGLFTTMLIDKYREMTFAKSFLRSFFKVKESVSKNVSIEVQRGDERVAVDVARGSNGNRNSFSKSTMKIYSPAYYREFFDVNELDLYDRLYAAGSIDEDTFVQIIDEVVEKIAVLQATIDRAYELQCAQVLLDGIVQLKGGDNIDFKRKAESLVDLEAGNYWSGAAVDPAVALTQGADFIRQIGKGQGAVMDIIFGREALLAYENNLTVKDRAKFVQYGMDKLTTPQATSTGATFKGEISFGTYTGRVWAYNEFYDKVVGDDVVSTPYLDPKKIIMLPENPRFNLAYAAVPQLLRGAPPKKGAYLISRYEDEQASAEIIDVKSAGIAVPVAIDQIFTAQVVGS